MLSFLQFVRVVCDWSDSSESCSVQGICGSVFNLFENHKEFLLVFAFVLCWRAYCSGWDVCMP